MAAVIVVTIDPGVKIGLKGLQIRVQILTERDLIELFLNRSMEAFANTVCLRAIGLRFCMIDIVHCKV